MKGLSEKRLSDYMAEQIADEILAGRIEGGSQLKQEELAEVFGASRIPIREAFQVLESQGLIVRLATKRIYTVELDEEQIELIFEMIGEILKKAVQHVLNTKSQTEEKEVFSTETRPDQLLLAQMENGYLTNLLKNASECYIRFATKCKETDGKKETEKAICEKIAGALNGAEKYTKTFAKAVNSEIDRWVLLLAEQVKEERRKKMPSAKEKVAAELRKAILSRQMKEGEILSLDSVASQLNVSAMPVREAFQILARDGLIQLRKNKGAVVLGITETYIREHYQLRAILESAAAKLAAEPGTDIAEIEDGKRGNPEIHGSQPCISQ